MKLKWVFFFLLILRYRIQYMYIDVESSNCFNCFFLLGPTFFPTWSYIFSYLVLHFDLLGTTFWPTWSYILTYLVLQFDLLGPTVWPTWSYILTYLVLHFDLLGPTFWPTWSYSLTYLVLQFDVAMFTALFPTVNAYPILFLSQKIKMSNPIHEQGAFKLILSFNFWLPIG